MLYGAAARVSLCDVRVRSVAVAVDRRSGAAVEFVAALAWVAELFPPALTRSADSMLATQAFSAAGGLLLTAAYCVAVTYGDSLPAIRGGHEAWR